MAKHPGVRRLDHVSIVAEDPRKTVELLGRLLGGEVGDRFEEEAEGFEGAYVYLPDNRARVEVLGPLGSSRFWRSSWRRAGGACTTSRSRWRTWRRWRSTCARSWD